MKRFNRLINLLLFLIYCGLVSCTNPLGGDRSESQYGNEYQPGVQRVPFTKEYSFNSSSDYTIGNSDGIEISAGVVRLSSIDQVDDSTSGTNGDLGFQNGNMNDIDPVILGTAGVSSLSNNKVALNVSGTDTNNAELDPSWAPQWSHLAWYWKMNGSGIVSTDHFAPEVGSDSDCYFNNTTGSYVAGKVKTAVVLGSNQLNCTVPAGSSLVQINSQATIIGWVKLSNAQATTWGSLHSYSLAPHGFWVQRYNANSTVYFGFSTSAHTNQATTELSVLDGSWHHIAATWNNGTVKTYLDGKLYNTAAYQVGGGFDLSGAILTLRAASVTENTYLDEWAIWKSELSELEISAIYSRQIPKYSGQYLSRIFDGRQGSATWDTFLWKTPLPFGKELVSNSESNLIYSDLSSNLSSGLVGLWHFNELSGSTVVDSSLNSNVGTVTGTPTFAEKGTFGNGIRFTNSSQNISVPSLNDSAFPSSGTLSLWLRISSNSASVSSIFDGWNGGRNHIFVRTYSNDMLQIAFQDNPATYIFVAGISYQPNLWHNIVVQWSSVEQIGKVYKDGVLVSSNSYTNSFMPSGQSFKFSSGGTVSFVIDESALWNRVLSPVEVVELYRRGANRVKYQIRTCTNESCSDRTLLATGWTGYDGTSTSYFSELNNTSSAVPGGSVQIGSPNIFFFALQGIYANFSNWMSTEAIKRYFQYRMVLESDDTSAIPTYPEVNFTSVGGRQFDTSQNYIISTSGINAEFVSLDGFTEVLGANSCSGGVRYLLAIDGMDWKYWNGSSWASGSDYAVANQASTIHTYISSFPGNVDAFAYRNNSLYVKVFLNSDGVTPCELSKITVTGSKY